MTGTAILEVDDLTVVLVRPGRAPATVVDGVSLRLEPGDRVGLVGESGSGKTMLGLGIMQLLPPVARVARGSVAVGGRTISSLAEKELCKIRGTAISMVFQDPLSGLDPLKRVGSLLTHAARREGASRAEAARLAVDSLRAAGVPAPEERMAAYPHQLSGGLRQRVMIALALVNAPSVVVADEVTTALDATIQAQLLDLLRSISTGRGIVLITHDLGVAAEVCTRTVVLYAGRVMEEGPTSLLLDQPAHPYTRGLLACRPVLGRERTRLTPIPGAPPRVGEARSGCPFAPRCPHAQARCTAVAPPLHQQGDRKVACWFPGAAEGGGPLP